MKTFHTMVPVLSCLLLTACSAKSASKPVRAASDDAEVSKAAPDKQAVGSTAHEAARTCSQAPGFRYESIDLPPEFAPQMPRGSEELWFAPGMFEPRSEGYWSYVFSLNMPDYELTGAEEITQLLNLYYRGLIAAVAESRAMPVDLGAIAAAVSPQGEEAYAATLTVPDVFGSGALVDLHLELVKGERCLTAIASPVESPMRGALREALACLPCTPSLAPATSHPPE